jgi:formate--tetrahydrofolate ligase
LAWRKSIEVFEDGAERPSTLSLFPADRCEVVIPDANIAHGISSVIAQRMALAYADYVVNEAGFAADLGAEKYLDIVMPSSEIKPSAAVLGATVRAIRRHDVNAADLKPGLDNLAKHRENLRKFCLPTVVAVNRSHDEIEADLDSIRKFCTGFGVESAFAEVFEKDREGGRELAEKMLHAAEQSNTNAIQPLYSATLALEEKIAVVAKEIYGADGIEIRPDAKSKIAKFTELGFAGLPVCIAKTQHSLSDDPKKLGAPKGWRLTVNDAH